VILLKLCCKILFRFFIAVVIISALLVPAGFCQETEDSQIFISGFNAYQQKEYATTIEKMNEVLQKYPDTPLRDMALFWLSRSYFKSGNQQEAARFMSQFTKEYPDNPLKGTVEEELLNLTARYEKGEKLTTGAPVVKAQEAQAAQKAKAEKAAQEKAEQQRLAQQKAAREKAAAEQAEQQRQAALKVERDRELAQKAEQERIAAEKAEQQRLAQEKAAREKIAAEQAEQQRLEREKPEQLQKAAAQAELERIAAEKSAMERLAQAKAARETATEEKPVPQLQTQEEAERERAAAEKMEQQRLAALKADEERLVAGQEAIKRLAAEKANKERIAAERAAAEAESARLVAAKKEQDRLAAAQAEEQRQARQREAEEKSRAEKTALREKAISQYKSIIEKYPGSKAATAAAAKLQELGIAVALPAKAAAVEQKPEEQPENAQVLRLEVAQYAGFEFNLLATPKAYDVARRNSLPFEITNRGNGNDSFYFESGFPAEFNVSFAAAAAPEQAINQTPVLAPGESFKGLLTLAIPADSIDGLRITYPVKVASRFMSEATQSREVGMIAAAPLLRAVVKTEKTQPLPGEKVAYRIALLNVGSTAAQDVTFRLNFPPQLEPVDYAAAGFKQEMKAALVIDGLQIKPGESREYSVTFQLKDDSLAGQELLTRVELINNPLKSNSTFISNVAHVQPQHGIMVHSGSDRLVVIPGQTISVPFVVTNTGNIREKFKIASVVKGAQEAIIFRDLDRNGVRHPNEPVITEVGPLEPKEEASIIMEIKTQRNASDGTEGSIRISFNSEGDVSRSANALASLVYSRPVLQMAMAGRDGRLRPGEVASFDLNIINRGSNIARVVELLSAWPEQLELVAAEPANSSVTGGNILWKFNELGAGEKRTIKVSFRVKQGTGVGTNIQVKNVLKYEDQLGNRY